ncbi:hypothetical protein QFC21_005564 [Naganishia friedmannii]|uniref:Uncharacterized protein n=1 Tax=Naganishia friedmannii TaxID=89922 RepID=A0ACC2V8S9_9TREE|nr:hypothetical protein QFC21_005564 [Naganishia friedmannii]
MGNSQSTTAAATAGQNDKQQQPTEQVIRPQEQGTSVQFAPSLISQLSSTTTSPSSSEPIAHTHHDTTIMARLHAESERLRTQESEIMHSISRALEKENLDAEKPGQSSALLGRDMEQVREKLERWGRKRGGEVLFEGEGGQGEHAQVRKQRDAVVQCYLNNQDRPLDCWKQVDQFKHTVGNLEADFVASLR